MDELTRRLERIQDRVKSAEHPERLARDSIMSTMVIYYNNYRMDVPYLLKELQSALEELNLLKGEGRIALSLDVAEAKALMIDLNHLNRLENLTQNQKIIDELYLKIYGEEERF